MAIEEKRTFDDCESWQDKFNDMAELTDDADKWCTPKVDSIASVMKSLEFPLNNNQLGVSAVALYKVLKLKEKKLFF